MKSYFESSHVHRYIKTPEFYSSIAEEIKKVVPENRTLSFLDIGCGDGSFMKALAEQGLEGEYVGVDLSKDMLLVASQNLHGLQATLVLADGLRLPFGVAKRFDVIHIDSVLHHLIGKTRGESLRLVERMLEVLIGKISSNGLLIVEEVYYDSYIYSKITSFLVFYGLKMVNSLELDLSFTKEIRPGLEVNFLHEKQLEQMLGRHGPVSLLNRMVWDVPHTYQLFLLKERGHITYSMTKI